MYEDEEEPAPVRAPPMQAQKYNEPEEEEGQEEFDNNQYPAATYGGGRTEEEFSARGAAHEDEF